MGVGQLSDLIQETGSSIHQEVVEVDDSLLQLVHGSEMVEKMVEVLPQRGGCTTVIHDETGSHLVQLVEHLLPGILEHRRHGWVRSMDQLLKLLKALPQLRRHRIHLLESLTLLTLSENDLGEIVC